MSCTDDDAQWTRCSDECASDMSCEAIAAPVRGVIRVAGFRPETEPLPVVEEVTEVVLDSGADESCLPYAYAGVGCKASTNQRANFSDAQGNPLRAYGWRYAQVILDNGVTSRERFLVTDVTSPLLACGKLYKAGWSVQHENNELVLSKGSRKVPVRFRHNSLVVDGSIRTVTSKPSDGFVRAVSLNPVLESMVNKGNEFFEELIPGVQGLKCESDAYLDVSLYLPMEGMQYRTTLVCVDPVMRIWELWELCRDVTTLDVLDEQFADGVERTVLTIASREALTAEQLGIVMQGDVPEAPDGATDVPMHEGEGEPAGVAQEVGGIGSPPPFESTVPGTPDLEALFASDVEGEKQHHDGANVPVAQQAALEAATRDDEMTGDFIEVNGVRVTADSALSVMRKACEYLNIGRSGGKAKVYKRLCEHLKRLELAEGVRQKQERAQGESREPREVPLVKEPTLHERLQHNLTHAPYREWCEHCVMHKARSDRASATVEPKRAVSVLSFDFGFTGRELDPENKLITLCVKDRATGWREAIPTKRKGGPESTKFLTSEIVRLCNVLGYNDVTIRCDPEPSCKTLQQEVQKARGRLGQRTRLEQSGEEEKASNGAAEEAVESTRQQACVLLSAYEHNTGKQVGSLHPLHAWAARHGSWLMNRYVVARDQQTPFECTFQSPYTGKLVEFGECVMAMCRTAMTNKPVKGSAKWVRSLWLGKANASDGHLVVTAGGKLLITRSIRRTPERWDSSLHDCIKAFGSSDASSALCVHGQGNPCAEGALAYSGAPDRLRAAVGGSLGYNTSRTMCELREESAVSDRHAKQWGDASQVPYAVDGNLWQRCIIRTFRHCSDATLKLHREASMTFGQVLRTTCCLASGCSQDCDGLEWCSCLFLAVVAMAALWACGAGAGPLALRAPLGLSCDPSAAMVASSAAARAGDSLDFHDLPLLVFCDGSYTGDLAVSMDFRDFGFNGGFYQLRLILGKVSDSCDFDGVADLRVGWSATSSTTSNCCSTCTTAYTCRDCSRTWSLVLGSAGDFRELHYVLFLVYRGGYYLGELGNDYLDLRDFGYNGVFYQLGQLVGQVSGFCDFGGVANFDPGSDYVDLRDCGFNGLRLLRLWRSGEPSCALVDYFLVHLNLLLRVCHGSYCGGGLDDDFGNLWDFDFNGVVEPLVLLLKPDFPWDHPGFVAGGLGKMRKQREAKPVEAVAEPAADEVGVLGPVSPLLAGPGDEAASDPETSVNYSPSLPASEHKSNGPDGSAGSSTSSSSSSDDDGNAPAEQSDAAMQGVEAEVPQGVAGVPSAGGDANAEERPSKAAKLRAVTQNEFYHNDASIDFNFEDAELDELEGYDYGLADYYFSEEAGGSDATPDELWRPFGPTEPSLSEAEMLMIDSAADDFEIRRLLAMHVLEALTCDAAEQAQTEGSRLLSTKFVRSWRIKMRKLGNGTEQQQYLRRSRFVGREYAWMDKDRTELFAPASSSLLTRLLPSAFMRSKGDGHACCVLDVADAFLTVDQRIPTVVRASLGDQQSHVQHFRLLKLLPGQRDGTIRWHESFTEYLDSKLGLEPYVPCPALFKLKNVAVAGLLHVDDLFSEGQRKGLDVMVSCVQDKYKCTVSWLCEHGDEVSFLKKAYRLVRDDLLIIQPHPRHVEKLVEMFNLTRARSKSSPLPTTLPTDDEELTGEQSSMFRTAVGVLLYLQSDVIEAQFGIRWLAQHMSRPTTGALRVLKHMILYLRDTSGYAIGFPVPTIGIGVSVQSKAGHDVLETHTDADWAGDKVHRKSVSGCVITLNSHLLSSSSRTQKSIALSSGESEYASAVSGTCDQVFIRNAVEFVLGTKVESHLLLDSAAARGVIARQGAGRIRHLEAKMLWLQQYARESLQVHPVDGKHNVSDLGTKSLQGPRIRALLHKVGIRDANDDYALVGSEEFQNLLDGNTVRKLVRMVKQQGNAGNSVGLQVAMIVLSHALSQHAVAAAADSEEQDVGADDGTDGMHSIVQQVLEMIMLVFTFAGEYAQLRNVILSMRGDASGDDGMSPASPRGARSKRMTKPPKRSCDDNDDEGARGESANAGDVPMSSHESPGRLNFNVPLTPGASVKLEVSSGSASEKPSSSAASTSSAGDADVPRARRPPVRPKPKARNSGDDEVWVSGAQGGWLRVVDTADAAFAILET
ncbi:unnamed protein product [Symbiodinium sp. CCMP2592]|nr:unnamed protein product [Symbiodinium sp. CCMP2592]